MIDPGFLDELTRYTTSVQRRVESRVHGQQRSTDVGEGRTFSDHRNYTPGDDTRLLDWRVYARTEELYIKQYEAERNLTVHVLLDASASMDFGTPGPGPVDVDTTDNDTDNDTDQATHKFEYAAKLGLGFASLAAAEHNDFRFSIFRETFDRLDRRRSTQGEVLELVDRCNEIEPAGTADFRQAFRDYAATIDSKSLVFIASDFLGDPADIEAGIATLQRNDCTLAHVIAPEERAPDTSTSGETIFIDPERDNRLRTYFGSRRLQEYRERLHTHMNEIEAVANRVAARHSPVDTGRDFFDSFADTWIE